MSALFALVAAAETVAAPICTDRPTKANAICTVPPGKVQLESSITGWSLTEAGGTRSKVLSLGSTVVKLGLSKQSDLQVAITPLARLTVEDSGGTSHVSGFGDVLVRYKQRLTSEGSAVQVAAIPFVKLPTARRRLGNGKAEGGIAVPINFALSGPVTMTLGPEVDLLADGDGEGRHPALINLVNVAGSITPRLTLVGELWSNLNFDPDGTIKQASADIALAYAASDDLQLDAGANFGLTRNTADVELYVGASARF